MNGNEKCRLHCNSFPELFLESFIYIVYFYTANIYLVLPIEVCLICKQLDSSTLRKKQCYLLDLRFFQQSIL